MLVGIANIVTMEKDGRLTATISTDAERLIEILENEADGGVVHFILEGEADGVAVEFSGNAVKALADKHFMLIVAAPFGTYHLPAVEVIAGLPEERSSQMPPMESLIVVNIAKSLDEQVRLLQEAARAGGFVIAAPPVDFSVSILHGGQTFDIARFGRFVKREMPLPPDANPNDVTTAVLMDQDGNVRHVPTYVEMRDGFNFAVINSLTNSTYALVRYAPVFTDTKHHWAESAIRDLASRMIAEGKGEGRFDPDAAITRAEFAAIAVRAFGIPVTDGVALYADVPSDAWFAGAVAAAHEYGLVNGYADGSFRPGTAITRQEAAALLVRLMRLAGMDDAVTDEEEHLLLSGYQDGGETAAWARQAAAAAVKHGLMIGSDGKLRLTDNITRAETAMVFHRLLKLTGLIGGTVE